MTYEEWLKKRQQNQTAGNTGGSSKSAEAAAKSQSTGASMSYEEWMNARTGNGPEELWKKSGIEAMDRDFWAFAKDERRWLEQGAFSRQYSTNAERWRGNIAQERAWLEKYGARLGDNAQRISDALDGYENTLNYYDSLYAATEEYEKAGKKISDYITAGVDPAQIDMAGLLQGKANVSSGATVVLATDQYSKEQEQLLQSFQPFTTGTAMDEDNQTALGKEVSGQRARTKMALAWLEQHQKELGEETYQGLKGYYENAMTQLDLMDSTIQWYADGKSAAVYQDMGSMIQLFQEGKAPTAELAQQEESLYEEVQKLQGEVSRWQGAYDGAISAVKEGRVQGKNLQIMQENITVYRDNLRGYKQLLAQKQQELQEVQEREAFYWALAFVQRNEDPNSAEEIANGEERYESERATRDQERDYEPNLAVGFGNANPMGAMMFDASMIWGKNEESNKNHPIALDIDHLSEDEKENFFYLVGKGYDSMAAQYVNDMAIDRRRKEMEEVEEWAGTNFGTQVLALFQQSLLFPFAGYDILASYIKSNYSGLDVDPNLGPAAIKDSLNSGVAKAWDEWSGTLPDNLPVVGGKGLGTVYQMGVSTGESYGSAAAMGPYATIFMGLSAASSAYNEAVMNGASPEQALVQGAAQGVAEALYEKISIGRWLDGKDYGSIIKNALVQGGVEASEEMLTSITNAITDRLIMQDKSAFNRAVQRYIDEGDSKEEAEDKAWRELLEEIAFDSVSGFITGGVMGGASSAVNYISTGKTAQQILNGANSSSLEDLQEYYVAQLAAGVQESDTAQEQKQKIAAWLRQGGEYTNEQMQQAKGMAEAKLDGREVVYPQTQEKVEPEYTGQRYEMAAEEIIDNARGTATEGFTGLGMSQREAEQIANNLERAIRTGEITDKRIDQMKPTDTSYLAVIGEALNVEIPQAKGIVQSRANVRAAIEAARARYLGEAAAPAIEIGQEQAEQLRAMSDEELQLQLELERETRDDTSAQPIVRQQAQQALDVLEQEYRRRNGGAKNVQQQEQAAPAPAAKQGEQAERGTKVRNAEPKRNDRVGSGEQGGAVPKRDTSQVEQGRKGENDQGDRGKGVRKKRDLSRFENIAKTKSTRDYLGKAGAEEVTLGEVTEEYWTDEMRQAAEKAEAAGLTVHYVVGSILRANGDRGGGGVYYRGTILASVNDVRFLPEQLVEHELYHADATQEATEEILAAIREKYTEEEFERIVREYADEYEGIIAENDVQGLYEEIAADAAGGMNRFADTGKVAESREQAQEIISRKGREAQRGDRARAPPAEPKYSTEADDAAYMEAVEEEDAKRPWEIVSDEQHAAAREMGYPVLDGEQVIPFKTWVQATDIDPDTGEPRNNYGLVVSNSVTTRQLGVNFWNKHMANGNRTEGNAEFRYVQYQDLHPVQGQYQMTDAEYASLMESVPEEVVREQIDFMGDNAAEFSKMYEEILWQREQQRLRDEENGLKLDEAPEGFPWSYKKPLRSTETRLSPRDAARYLEAATGKEWLITRTKGGSRWKAVPGKRNAEHVKDEAYEAEKAEAESRGETFKSLKEYAWEKLQEAMLQPGEQVSYVHPEGIDRAAFKGTEAINKLGIRISGSVVDYADTETIKEREMALRKSALNIQKMERALTKNEGKAGLGSETIKHAKLIAEGDLLMEDIPKRLNRRDVIKLAEMMLDHKMIGEDLSNKRKLAINRELQAEALNRLPDQEGVDAGTEQLKRLKLAVMNYRTPERNLRAMFGEERGADLFDYYFRTARENEAERKRWMQEQFDGAREFIGKNGKAKGLNKQESAYVHAMLDMEGYSHLIERSKNAEQIKELSKAWEEAKKKDPKADLGARAAEMEQLRNGAEKQEVKLDATEKALAETLTYTEVEWAQKWAEWRAMQADHKTMAKIDKIRCDNAVMHFRAAFDSYYKAMVDFMVAHGLTPLGHIDYYAPHLTINDRSEIMAGFFDVLGLKSEKFGNISELPADIAGKTQDFRPTRKWNPFALKRTGTKTDYNIVEAFEKYVTHVAEVFYHHDDLLKLRALEAATRNTANRDWQKEMRNLIMAARSGDLQEKQRVLRKLGVKMPEDMDPVEMFRQLSREADVEKKHNWLIQLEEVTKEEILTEEQVHALFDELGSRSEKAFMTKADRLFKEYGLSAESNSATLAEAEDKLNRIFEHLLQSDNAATQYTNFVQWLNNYNNLLAGKQYGGDRGMEYSGGRKLLDLANNVSRRFSGAKVIGNMGSVIAQAAQMPAIIKSRSAAAQAKAFRDIMASVSSKFERGRELREWKIYSDILTGKRGVEYIREGFWEKVIGYATKPMEWVDSFVTTFAARSAYYDAIDGKVDGIAKGNRKAANRYADDFATQIMGVRDKGSRPNAFSSKLGAMVNVFQVEALNLMDHFASDMPAQWRADARKYGKAKASAKLAWSMFVYFAAAFMLNRGGDELYGQTPAAFSVADYILQFIAAGYGVTTNELIFGGGDKKEEFQWGDAWAELGYEVMGDIPLVSNIAAMAGYGDQKMPLPDVNKIWDGVSKAFLAMTDQGVSGKEAMKAIGKALAEVMPLGNQINKTIQGIIALADSGVYNDDGALQWAVDHDAWSILQNVIFGANATQEAQAYYAGGYGALNAQLTEAYEEFVEDGMEPNDAYDLVYELRKIDRRNADLPAAEVNALQREWINQADISDEDKLYLFTQTFGSKDPDTGMIEHKDAEAFDLLMDAGMSWAEIQVMYEKHEELENVEEMESHQKNLDFNYWVRQQNYNAEQEELILKNFGQVERFVKLADSGIGDDAAKELEEQIQAYSDSLPEGESLQSVDKIRIIMDYGLSDSDCYKALRTVLGDGTFNKLSYARDNGISCQDYMSFYLATKDLESDRDEEGKIIKGQATKDKVLAYIDSLPISREGKDILFLTEYKESGLPEAPWN